MSIFSPKGSITPVGLDLGTTSFRVIELKQTSGLPMITNLAKINVPPGVIVEGEITDPSVAVSSLVELWKKTSMKHKHVTVGVANQKVIVRLVELPYMDEQELRGALQYQAQDYIAIPIDEAILDFQIVGELTTAEDEHMIEVLLVAAQKDMIQSYVDTLHAAGLEAEIIDVSSFALLRSLVEKPKLVFEGERETEATVLMNISAGITNIVVVEEGIPRFSRVTGIAGDNFTKAVANAMNLSFAEAEELKTNIGLPTSETEAERVEAPELVEVGVKSKSKKKVKKGNTQRDSKRSESQYEINQNAETVSKVQQALLQETAHFIEEIRRSLDYYLTQARVSSIQNLVLTGGGSRLKYLPNYLEKALQVNVSYGYPLKKVEISPHLKEEAEREELSLAICLGLALRGVEV